MTVAALLPERVVVAREVPSLFGGLRVRLHDAQRRFHPATLADDDDGVDVARLLSLLESPGQASRIAALCRRLPDETTTTAPEPETAPLPVLLSAFVRQLVDVSSTTTTTTLAVTPQVRAHPRFAALLSACETAGVALTDLMQPPQQQGRLLLVDDAEVLCSPGWRTIADAGQGAMIAAGLCHDVAAFFVEAAGPDGREVFDKGFDDVGRAWFVQRIERALRAGFGKAVVWLSGGALVPPLSSSTSKLSQLGADASDKARELSTTLRAMQEKQRQALVRVNLELRLPAARDSWWTDKLASFEAAGDVVGVVGAPSRSLTGLKSALLAKGVAVEIPGAGWLHRIVDDDDDAAGVGPLPVALPLAVSLPAPAPPKAVGGVRSAVDFDVSLPAPPPVDVAPPGSIEIDLELVTVTSLVSEPREVDLPASYRDLWVSVDGALVDPAALAGPRVTLDAPVRHGSVVVVAWDEDEPDDAVLS